jgi:hypothetical protein
MNAKEDLDKSIEDYKEKEKEKTEITSKDMEDVEDVYYSAENGKPSLSRIVPTDYTGHGNQAGIFLDMVASKFLGEDYDIHQDTYSKNRLIQKGNGNDMILTYQLSRNMLEDLGEDWKLVLEIRVEQEGGNIPQGTIVEFDYNWKDVKVDVAEGATCKNLDYPRDMDKQVIAFDRAEQNSDLPITLKMIEDKDDGIGILDGMETEKNKATVSMFSYEENEQHLHVTITDPTNGEFIRQIQIIEYYSYSREPLRRIVEVYPRIVLSLGDPITAEELHTGEKVVILNYPDEMDGYKIFRHRCKKNYDIELPEKSTTDKLNQGKYVIVFEYEGNGTGVSKSTCKVLTEATVQGHLELSTEDGRKTSVVSQYYPDENLYTENPYDDM